MNYKSLAGLTIASALLLGACGEEKTVNKGRENTTQSTTNEDKGFANEEKQYNQYSKALQEYAAKLNEIAEGNDASLDSEDIVSQKSVDQYKSDSQKYKDAKENFIKDTKDLKIMKDATLDKMLNDIATVYSMAYEENAKNLEVGINDANYSDASLLAGLFTNAAHISALEYINAELENYGKEELDANLTEKIANNLSELVYTDTDDVDEAYNDMHKASISLTDIPSDANDKLITPGFTMELFKAAGMNDGTKDTTVSEYNDTVARYNKETNPLIVMGEIKEPTTMDINNNLISRWNSLVDVYDENGIERE
ncbi:hypothetical protein QA541_07210 [Macrococcus psychrotolerans]|uniref:Lipoprotein n=1 Tax=Macrococcus psychrotolerans TaxID=3039389 RepID=A0AAU6R7F4_9STAP